KFRAASEELRRLSQLVNLYITEKAPFNLVKTDVEATATVVRTTLQAVTWLNIMWAPILPHTAQLVHEMLGFDGPFFGRQFTERATDDAGDPPVLRYDHAQAVGRWHPAELKPGQPPREPRAPFVKLEPDTAEKETAGSE